jgi:hypothetical protein
VVLGFELKASCLLVRQFYLLRHCQPSVPLFMEIRFSKNSATENACLSWLTYLFLIRWLLEKGKTGKKCTKILYFIRQNLIVLNFFKFSEHLRLAKLLICLVNCSHKISRTCSMVFFICLICCTKYRKCKSSIVPQQNCLTSWEHFSTLSIKSQLH